MPWLYYSSLTVNVLNNPSLPVEFTVKPPMELEFVVVMHSFEGQYLGMKSIRGGLLQLCKMNDVRMDAIWTFGTTYSSEVGKKNMFLHSGLDFMSHTINVLLFLMSTLYTCVSCDL